jgi:hypothetical protein
MDDVAGPHVNGVEFVSAALREAFRARTVAIARAGTSADSAGTSSPSPTWRSSRGRHETTGMSIRPLPGPEIAVDDLLP